MKENFKEKVRRFFKSGEASYNTEPTEEDMERPSIEEMIEMIGEDIKDGTITQDQEGVKQWCELKGCTPEETNSILAIVIPDDKPIESEDTEMMKSQLGKIQLEIESFKKSRLENEEIFSKMIDSIQSLGKEISNLKEENKFAKSEISKFGTSPANVKIPIMSVTDTTPTKPKSEIMGILMKSDLAKTNSDDLIEYKLTGKMTEPVKEFLKGKV